MIRSGAMRAGENLTGNIDFFTLFTQLDLTVTGDYTNNTQKDFESVVQVIGLRAMPVIMNEPVYLDGTASNTLEDYGSQVLTGAGWIFKFAFEMEGVHSIQHLVDELHGIVLNAGVIDTKNSHNMEFSKQDLI